MKYYFSSEKLEGDNKYDWRKWNQYTNAVKSLSLKDPPLNLIVNLKKFDIHGAKIKAKIEYPYSFNLGDYIKSTGKGSRSKSTNMYELYAVINHEGYYSHWGHYNWYVKGFDETWYRCDDSKIKKIGSQNQTSSEKAYILFYRLIKTPQKKKSKRKAKMPVGFDPKEESKSWKSGSIKSPPNNRKRKRETKPAKSKPDNSSASKERPSSKEKNSSWGMSAVVKSSGSCSKRFKKAEADNFDTSAEISI